MGNSREDNHTWKSYRGIETYVRAQKFQPEFSQNLLLSIPKDQDPERHVYARTKHRLGHLFRRKKLLGLFGFAAAVAVLISTPALAVEFDKGDLSITLDTTLSYGLTWRLDDRSSELIGLANGGSAFSVNGDDGNLNYDTGVLSNLLKITSEFELSYRNFGTFFRASAFYDFEAEDGKRSRTPLSELALNRVGNRAFFLDAYLWSKFDIGNRPVDIRIGEQVVSWGESTFIQNSINAINSVEVSAIRLPGSELREALLPEGMVWVNLGLSENTSLELLYLYDWQETEIDPPGSYFATSDFVGDGGTHVFLGTGASPDLPPFPFFFTDTRRPFLAVPREPDREATVASKASLPRVSRYRRRT